jgi:pimeloyl-ACP methyl ester carboxylesterase
MSASFPPGQTLSINGMQLYYVLHGQGEPLVLLTGFMGASSDWEPFLPDFASEYQMVMPDLRGHGRSTNPLKEFTHRQAAGDLIALLDHLGIERFKAIGLSGGGNILLHVATRQPERVAAMVLVSATNYFPKQARAVMRQATLAMFPEAEQRRMWQRHPQGEEQIQTLLRQAQAMQDSYDDMNFTPPLLSTITARTLIVYGDRDPLYPVQIALEMYSAIPHAYLWVIPNGGHIPAIPRDVFLQRVAPFLRGDWEQKPAGG